MSNDPLWDEYLEAMRGLAQVPDKLAARRAEADAERDQAVAAARDQREYELRRCAEWNMQARRELANAEARLVASKVLIPDTVAAGQPVTQTDPELVAEQVRGAGREFAAALTALGVARRRARDAELLEQAAARRRLYLRRRLITIGVVVAVVLVLIMLVAN